MKPKIGIDIIENQRLKLNPAFLKKILTNNELKILKTLPTEQRKIEFSAGRWAVKEAIFKVINDQIKLPLNQIEIKNDASGKPQIINPELANVTVSISHEKHYSVGVAFKWGD